MIVTQGAQSQVRKIGPSPVRKGGELSTFPNSNEEPPGKTRDAPTMLATEHTRNKCQKQGLRGSSECMLSTFQLIVRLSHMLTMSDGEFATKQSCSGQAKCAGFGSKWD